MTLLVLGLALWIAAHLFKRVAPEARGALTARMGEGSKGLFAAILVGSIVLMVLGYRAAAFIPIYTPPSWGVHLNNLAMVFAIALFGLGSSKSNLRGKLRHPQLTGFGLWAAAHLLVNGDLASVVLFATLLLWAVTERVLINAQDPAPAPFTGGSMAGTIRLGVITAVLYAIITAVHSWVGPWPFAGG